MQENNQVRELSGAEEKCWVNWRYEVRDGKKTKVPYTPHGARASSTNSKMWSTYAEVAAAADHFDGIGIILDGTILGIDFDHWIVNGDVPPHIEEFIEAARTYTEISPSGTGLHVLLRLSEPLALEKHKHIADVLGDGTSRAYEVYTDKRYLTVTGELWKVSHPLRTVTAEEAKKLLSMLGYPWQTGEVCGADSRPVASLTSYEELLGRMFAAKNGADIRSLYEGDTSRYGGDDSAADAALCAHLAYWCNGDRSLMESLWLASPLGAREKTQKRADYRRMTIESVIASAHEMNSASTTSRSIPESVRAARTAIVRSFESIEPKPVDWLWLKRIAKGKVTLIVGDPGLSKSLLTVDIAGIVSTGSNWPVDNVPAQIGDVVLLSAEDDPADTIRPRLDAAGANVSRVHVVTAVQYEDGNGGKSQRFFSLQEDLTVLASVLEDLPNPQLVVIDPISAYLGSNVDSHKNSDIRALLAPLGELAARYGVAVIAVSHMSKSDDKKNPLYRIMGSLAFVAAARAAYMVMRDDQNPNRRKLLPVKNNLAPDVTGIAYSITTNGDGLPVLIWEQEAFPISREEFMASTNTQDDTSQTELAEMILAIELKDGPRPAKEVMKAAKEAGVYEKALRRACMKMNIVRRKEGFNANSHWTWELRDDVEDTGSLDDDHA